MKRKQLLFFVVASLVATVSISRAADIPVGAAPKGDATTVASRIIKYNFPQCSHVTSATRRVDGSIMAKCDGTKYLVFTVFNAQEGKTLELAMNCSAAKRILNVSCE